MKNPSLGIGLTALGFAQVRLGMPLYSTRYGDNTPRGVVVICKLSRMDCIEKILILAFRWSLGWCYLLGTTIWHIPRVLEPKQEWRVPVSDEVVSDFLLSGVTGDLSRLLV